MTSPGVNDARQRRRVLWHHPTRGDLLVTLVHWPIPVDQRQFHGNRPPRGGRKATVLLPNGCRASADPQALALMEES